MALSAASVWEVRPGTGSDTNGGGFVAGASGTDYSQQNAKNSAGNNISTTDGVGVGTTTWTSVTGSFTAAIVGNIIYLTGTGITTGWYQVVSYTNGTTIVLDRNPGTGTGATMNIGGALATISAAYGTAVLSNTIYIKATASYTVTATLTLTGINSGSPMKFIGYTSSRGDNGRVTWTTSTNSTPLMTVGTNPAGYEFDNIYFSNSAGTRAEALFGGLGGTGIGFRFVNCVFDGVKSCITGYNSGVCYNISQVIFDSCEMKNCSGNGLDCSPGISAIACIIHDNVGDGIHVRNIGSGLPYGGVIHLDRTVVYNNGAKGIDFAEVMPYNGPPVFLIATNCAILNSVGDGLYVTAQSGTSIQPILVLINTIIDSNGGYGINNAAATMGVLNMRNCAFRSNTSGDVNGVGVVKDGGSITLTADPFTNRSALDFSLNSTTGGGTACKAAGFPSALG